MSLSREEKIALASSLEDLLQIILSEDSGVSHASFNVEREMDRIGFENVPNGWDTVSVKIHIRRQHRHD
jgi:hypothetical protein